MSIPLSKLMQDIGIAVQNANAAIEDYAAYSYLQQGYMQRNIANGEDGVDNIYEPITYSFGIPTGVGKKKVDVPATILMNHSSLQLEQVDVKLRFMLEESDGEEVMVKLKSNGDTKDAYSLSELSMQFKTAPPSEGKSRIESKHIQVL